MIRLAAVFLLCCAALAAGGTRSGVPDAPVDGRAKLKAAVMTPYPGSREKTGDKDPVPPGKRDGAIPLPNYEGETLTLGLL